MDCAKAVEAVLVAIKPRFAEAIVNGDKRVEFRKVRFRREITHVVLYASSPISRVVAIVDVANLVHASPEELWERFSEVGQISEAEFREYYGPSQEAVGIELATVIQFAEGVRLSQLLPGTRPPQSFRYLSRETLALALELAEA